MKKIPFIHTLLFFPLILIYQGTWGQDYVLTTKGDSLTGEVKPLIYGPEKKVQLSGPDRSKKTFSLFEVRAFSSKGETYHPVKGENGYVFMKLLQPGYLSLYAYQPENQVRFDGLFLRKADGENIVVPNLGFKKYLSAFLRDCPAISDKIKSGELGKKDLAALVQAYNLCIDNRSIDHNKIIAGREEQTTKISVWDSLEEKIQAKDFSQKNDALEMITEIRKKIEREEKIPNFLLEGLKNSLQETGLTAELEQAIQEIH